jgi:hypothetical protein
MTLQRGCRDDPDRILSDRTCALRLSIRGHTCPVLTGEHSRGDEEERKVCGRLSYCRDALGNLWERADGALWLRRGMTLRWMTSNQCG